MILQLEKLRSKLAKEHTTWIRQRGCRVRAILPGHLVAAGPRMAWSCSGPHPPSEVATLQPSEIANAIWLANSQLHFRIQYSSPTPGEAFYNFFLTSLPLICTPLASWCTPSQGFRPFIVTIYCELFPPLDRDLLQGLVSTQHILENQGPSAFVWHRRGTQ